MAQAKHNCVDDCSAAKVSTEDEVAHKLGNPELAPEQMVMSQDRWCIYLPTKNVPFDQGQRLEDRSQVSTFWVSHPSIYPSLCLCV